MIRQKALPILIAIFLGITFLSVLTLDQTMPVQAQRATATPTTSGTTVVTTPTVTDTTALTNSVAASIVRFDSESIGTLSFADGAAVTGGDFQLRVDGLSPTPENGQYVLWLLSNITDTLMLATFTVDDNTVGHSSGSTMVITGTTFTNLPLLYNEAQITLEPLSAMQLETSADTNATSLEISDRVVLRAALPTTRLEQLRPLLELYTEEPAEEEDDSDEGEYAVGNGVLTAAKAQVDIAVQHTGFLRNALSENDIPQARRHAEHIINILDGRTGFMFGDLDRNGLPENPGNGVGVRVYLSAARETLPVLEDLFTAQALSDGTINVPDAIALSQSSITNIFDKALQIFASDTVTEANRFAGELTQLVDELDGVVDDAHNSTLQLITYAFDEPPATVTLPASVAAVPPTTTNRPTAAITGTATMTDQQTATQIVTPAPAERPSVSPTPALSLPPALPTIESSALLNPVAGQRWQHPVHDITYVYVPGTRFQMGSSSADAASPKEEPRHGVSVEGVWLQETEVTNAQYTRCIAAGICTPPANNRWDDPTFTNHPVRNIDWMQASTYAAWAGGRLPTEAEWERACRADDGRAYPWGDTAPDETLANYKNAIGDSVPVGSYPAGASAFGPLDLSGNLWEWTSSVAADYPYNATDGREDNAPEAGNRAVRGGSFYYTNYQIRCAARTGFAPATASEHIGLRVVLTEPTTVIRNPLDEALYLYVPGGTFQMGALAAEAASPKEEPRHAVTIDSYWLQETEVTNAQYARCVNVGICTPPADDRWADSTFADHPVRGVDWEQANTYAAWVGGRLPTEAEWERACRGSDVHRYAWGNTMPDETLANYNNSVGDTAPVGSYPAGRGGFGHLDLSGNLWEWTSTVETAYPYSATDGREDSAPEAGNRAVRGGSFYYTNYQIRCAARTGFAPATASDHIGLRVVLTVTE